MQRRVYETKVHDWMMHRVIDVWTGGQQSVAKRYCCADCFLHDCIQATEESSNGFVKKLPLVKHDSCPGCAIFRPLLFQNVV